MLAHSFSAGSSLYYAMKPLPLAKAKAIQALLELTQSWFAPELDRMEPSITLKKLEWWNVELGKLFQGEPSHPQLIALLPYKQSISEQSFKELLQQAIKMRSQHPRYTEDEMMHHASYIGGNISLLACNILTQHSLGLIEMARSFGVSLYLVMILQHAGDPNSQYLLAPQVHAEDPPAPSIERLIYLAREHYKRGLSLFNDSPIKIQSALHAYIVLMTLAMMLLDEIENEPLLILKAKVQLPPIRKAWIAWRTFRSLNKRTSTKNTTHRSPHDHSLLS